LIEWNGRIPGDTGILREFTHHASFVNHHCPIQNNPAVLLKRPDGDNSAGPFLVFFPIIFLMRYSKYAGLSKVPSIELLVDLNAEFHLAGCSGIKVAVQSPADGRRSGDNGTPGYG
jgi:hypothetical protein